MPRHETGINIFGYAFAEHGVGQAMRLLMQIADVAGERYTIIPYTDTGSRQAANVGNFGERDTRFDTNIICVNADSLPEFVSHVGAKYLEGRYNIGLWAWEVDEFPDEMAKSEKYLDEIWANSHFAAASIRSKVSCPVFSYPHPVINPGLIDQRKEDLGLPHCFLFQFFFDFNSVFERKNALALIAAFRKAFRQGCGALLIIKTINGDSFPDQLERLNASAFGHADIWVVDGYLDHLENQRLMQVCDCYVSLHRAEGFGLTMAEAMALGKPVIATAYSGNLDFMTEENSFLVPFNLVHVPPNCGPYPTSTHWADPDIAAAAQIMRQVFNNPEYARAKGVKAQQDIERLHCPAARSEFLSNRLRIVRVNHEQHGISDIFRLMSSNKNLIEENDRSRMTHHENPTINPEAGHEHRQFSTVNDLTGSRLRVFDSSLVDSTVYCGPLEGVKADEKGNLIIWGWAMNPDERTPAQSIILLMNNKQIPIAIPVCRTRLDVAEHLGHPEINKFGWYVCIPSYRVASGDYTFDAFALLYNGRFGILLPQPEGANCITIQQRFSDTKAMG